MWIDNDYINPVYVESVQSRGKRGSKGCLINFVSGRQIVSKMPSTQVVATLFFTKYEYENE